MFELEFVGNQKSLSFYFILLISHAKLELNIKLIFELRSNFWAL